MYSNLHPFFLKLFADFKKWEFKMNLKKSEPRKVKRGRI